MMQPSTHTSLAVYLYKINQTISPFSPRSVITGQIISLGHDWCAYAMPMREAFSKKR
jgi:hypothetical protein